MDYLSLNHGQAHSFLPLEHSSQAKICRCCESSLLVSRTVHSLKIAGSGTWPSLDDPFPKTQTAGSLFTFMFVVLACVVQPLANPLAAAVLAAPRPGVASHLPLVSFGNAGNRRTRSAPRVDQTSFHEDAQEGLRTSQRVLDHGTTQTEQVL